MIYYNHNAIRLIYIALFSISVAIWIGSNYRLLQLVSIDYNKNTIIEHIALYVALIPISLLFREVYQESKIKRRILNGYVIVNTLFVVVAIAFQELNFIHLTQSLYIYHFILVTEVVFILFSAIWTIKQRTQKDLLMLHGLLFLTCFVLLDLIRFWIEKFSSIVVTFHVRSFMPLGLIVFIICLISNYFYYTFHNLTTKAENELLKKLAYTDILTGLRNRARMDEFMEELNTSMPNTNYPNYAIINIDMNRLKTINDTFGHDTGDNYLKQFSNLLSSCFSDYGEVGRIGGDEFLIILPNISRETLELLLTTLTEKLRDENAKLLTNPISFSYGVCFSDEFSDATAKKMYRLADYRMYEMKKQSKRNDSHLEEETDQDEYFN
jgi:diguanylate cyclase (GGDEF)-like protein